MRNHWRFFLALLTGAALVFATASYGAVTDTSTRRDTVGDGATLVFYFTFPVQKASDVEVYVSGVKQTYGYAVALAPSPLPGGSVTFTIAPRLNATVRIQRATPMRQETVSPSTAKITEKMADRIVEMIQERARDLDDHKATADAIAAAANSETPVTGRGGNTPTALADWMAALDLAITYGVRCDGVTDDTTSIQAAINARVVVHLPGGVCRITQALTLPTGHKLFGRVSNESGQGTWLRQESSDYHILIVGKLLQHGDLINQYNQDNEVAYITFTGPLGKGIRTALTQGLRIHDNKFSGTVNGICMSSGLSCSTNDGAWEDDVQGYIFRNVFWGQTGNGIWHGDTRIADYLIFDNMFFNVRGYAFRTGYPDGGFMDRNIVFSELAPSVKNYGFVINQPVWFHFTRNQVWAANGPAFLVSSPRWSQFIDNDAVWTGGADRDPAFKVTSYGTLASNDVTFRGNLAREVYGTGFDIELSSPSPRYTFEGNRVNAAGWTPYFDKDPVSKLMDSMVLGTTTHHVYTSIQVEPSGVSSGVNTHDLSDVAWWRDDGAQVLNRDGFLLSNLVDARISGNTVYGAPDPEWLGSTTYALNDPVIVGTTTYRSLSNSNAGHDPETATTWWSSYGTTQRTRYWLNMQYMTRPVIRDNVHRGNSMPKAYYNVGITGSDHTETMDPTLITTNATLNYSDSVVKAAGASVITLTLPSATVTVPGKRITVIKTDATGSVSVAGYGGQTINLDPSYLMTTQWKRVTVVSDGSNWLVENSN